MLALGRRYRHHFRALPSDSLSNTEHCNASMSEALRADIADRMIANRAVLLQRIRRRLDARAGTQADPDDVFSTTLRRVDVLAASGDLVPRISDDQLLALASVVAQNAVRERNRTAGREQVRLRTIREALPRTVGIDPAANPEDTLMLLERHDADRSEADRLLRTLLETDLEILGLRLRGADWPTIAAELRTTPGAAHRRYFRALQKLASLGGGSESTETFASGPADLPAMRVMQDSTASLP